MADPLNEGRSPGHRPAHCSSAGTTRHRDHYTQPPVACQQAPDAIPRTAPCLPHRPPHGPRTAPHGPRTATTPAIRPAGANVGRMGIS